MGSLDLFEKVRQAFAGDTFLIVGFGRWTGPAAARFFERCGLPYAVSDCLPARELAARCVGFSPLRIHGGPQSVDHLAGVTQVLLSPGVPRSASPAAEAVAAGIPVWGDLDLLLPLLSRPRLAGITGTDGKTTTVTLLGEICARFGATVVCGNNGVPVMETAAVLDAADFAVVEVSSFMLEETRRLRFDAGVILNVAEDHVDRYPDPGDYLRAKLNLLRHLRPTDVFVRNADDPLLRDVVPPTGQVRDFGLSTGLFDPAADAFVFEGRRLPVAQCRLRGRQFIPDVLAALAVAEAWGLAPEPVLDAVRGFPGVPHRFQDAGGAGGVRLIDDSKATTVQAVSAALASCPAGETVVILGGREKHLDFSPLREATARLAGAICYGEAGARIRDQLARPDAACVFDFREAVRLACARVPAPGVVLLSPGCTSWDQFESYEVRGHVFAEEGLRALSERFAPGEAP